MDKKCIIVGAGDFSEEKLPIGPEDCLIAADGGLSYLERLGLQPDIVVGDFDSLSYIPHHPRTLKLPVEKDDTDMEAAIEKGIALGYEQFYLYGGCGGRIDHTLANIQLLVWLAKTGRQGSLFDRRQKIQVFSGPRKVTFSPEEKGIISVFACSDVCTGVFEKGLQYRLDNYTMTNDKPLGVSNAFTGRPAEVSVETGVLMIITERHEKKEQENTNDEETKGIGDY